MHDLKVDAQVLLELASDAPDMLSATVAAGPGTAAVAAAADCICGLSLGYGLGTVFFSRFFWMAAKSYGGLRA